MNMCIKFYARNLLVRKEADKNCQVEFSVCVCLSLYIYRHIHTHIFRLMSYHFKILYSRILEIYKIRKKWTKGSCVPSSNNYQFMAILVSSMLLCLPFHFIWSNLRCITSALYILCVPIRQGLFFKIVLLLFNYSCLHFPPPFPPPSQTHLPPLLPPSLLLLSMCPL